MRKIIVGDVHGCIRPVKKLLETKGKELGGSVKVVAFTRFEKGEGLEKREDDFAAEVEKMTSK